MSRPSSINLGLAVSPSEVLDPALWRARYAWGIALGAVERRDRGSLFSRLERARCRDGEDELGELETDEQELTKLVGDIPNETIRWHLRAAMSEAEYRLGMPMGINVCKAEPLDAGMVLGVHFDELVPRLPYTRGEALSWFRIDLPRRGIISVERIRAFYFDTLSWNISGANTDQIKLEWKNDGVLHIIPTNLESLMVATGGNYGVWELINASGYRSPVPSFWAVDFTYGPQTRDGQVGKIPAVLANWIYCAAGLLILGQSGLAQSKGLTNTSISIDGISRSVGLTASAQAGLYGALERSYDEAMKRIDFDKLRAQMKGIRVRKY